MVRVMIKQDPDTFSLYAPDRELPLVVVELTFPFKSGIGGISFGSLLSSTFCGINSGCTECNLVSVQSVGDIPEPASTISSIPSPEPLPEP